MSASATANSECLRGRKLWVSDFVSDIASEVAVPLSPTLSKPVDIRIDVAVSKGLEFILGHFNNETCWFPRTISTKATEGRQVVVYSKEEALVRFKAANYQDCKINAYPRFVEWKGVNRQAPNFIFIDLDRGRFKLIDRVLDKTLKNICEKFNADVHPTVIWSGHGYHIYLPVDAFVLEEESEFARFGTPSRKFIQFAEDFLSDGKADPCHTKGLSFKNCMIRIPASFNCKDGTKQEEVRIVQRWTGVRPSIKPLLFRFDHLLFSKSNELHKNKRKRDYDYEPKIFSTVWRNNAKAQGLGGEVRYVK